MDNYNNNGYDNGYNNNDNRNNNRNNNNNNKKPKNVNLIIFIIIAAVVTFIGLTLLSNMFRNATYKEISYDQFMQMIDEDKVKKVALEQDRILITPVEEEKQSGIAGVSYTYYTGYVNDDTLVPLLKRKGIEFEGYIPDSSSSIVEFLLAYVLPFLFIYIIFAFVYRRIAKNGGMMGGMGVGKSNAKVYVQKKTGVTFKDVAGQDEAKESLTEIVDFLHYPEKYAKIGAKLPKGALLVGPPGTGKTLLAKAVAGEADVPFFSLAGSDFVEMFVGVGASRVRDLFKEATKQAPCIIFIDEIDAIGRSRDSKYGGGDSEREQTLNQLLSEMDGFDTSKGIVILAATNRPEVLDKALLRPGRFDRRVIVEKPDLKGRIETLKVHAKNVKMDETVDFKELALATSGAVGADLANIINEAALAAVKAGREYVNQSDLFESVEVVFAGKEKKDRILSKQEKQIVAYHETGHALCIALQKHTEPVQKITIIPRTMGSLGYVMQVPEEEKYLNTQAEMEADIVTFLAGRAAEAIKFPSVTTGASNDIEQATNMARRMITMYGMSDEFGMVALESVQNRYLDGRSVMNCSEETATKIDDEVRRIIKESYQKAYDLLKANESVLDALAKFLIEKETITGKEFMKIYAEITGENLKAATEDGQEVDSAVENMEQAVEAERNTEPEADEEAERNAESEADEEAGVVESTELSEGEHKEE